jgi:hypothetical protein
MGFRPWGSLGMTLVWHVEIGGENAAGEKTMRWGSMGLLAMLVIADSACARPALQISQGMTMKELLDACGSDDPAERAENCDRAFQGLMVVAYDAAGGPQQDAAHRVCLPDVHESDVSEVRQTFRTRVTAWLRDHPDVQPLPFIGEGSRLAVVGAFACKP